MHLYVFGLQKRGCEGKGPIHKDLLQRKAVLLRGPLLQMPQAVLSARPWHIGRTGRSDVGQVRSRGVIMARPKRRRYVERRLCGPRLGDGVACYYFLIVCRPLWRGPVRFWVLFSLFLTRGKRQSNLMCWRLREFGLRAICARYRPALRDR